MEYRDEKRCNPHKLPVSVRADHLHDGRTLPRMFRTEDSVQAVVIDRVLDRTPIAGVVFDIYDGGELVSSMTTNADGVALSEPLHKGEYMVYERDNPTGYTGELNTLEAVVKSDETTHLSCTNQPIQGRIPTSRLVPVLR